MNDAVMAFVRSVVDPCHVVGKRVLEVGTLDVNGSARAVIAPMAPASYLGVDMQLGRGVDRVVSVSALCDQLGVTSFGLVVSMEMLEQV